MVVAPRRVALASEPPPLVIAGRPPAAFQNVRIGDAPNLPLTEFAKRFHEVPGDRRTILQCQGGYRSLIAASLLERAGWTGLVDLRGGYGAWVAAGEPVCGGS